MARRNLRNIDERILTHVIEEGAKNGIERISTKKIAGLLRITEPTIYVHFKNKQNLLSEAYHKALITLFSVEGLIDSENFGEVITHNLYLIGQQAAQYPNEVLYAIEYRHLPDFHDDEPAIYHRSDVFFKTLKRAWHHDGPSVNSACPYVDKKIYIYIAETISAYAYGIARKDFSNSPASAKFFSALMIGALQGGRATFLSLLTDEDKAQILSEAQDCGLLLEKEKVS
jgi:AcrR family transcriptional regulator